MNQIHEADKDECKCSYCGSVIRQGEWIFDKEEKAPRCPECNEFIDLPEGW